MSGLPMDAVTAVRSSTVSAENAASTSSSLHSSELEEHAPTNTTITITKVAVHRPASVGRPLLIDRRVPHVRYPLLGPDSPVPGWLRDPYNRTMQLAREIERRLERLVDGASAAVFRGKMHPVDMADRLLRQADFVVVQGQTGPEIPNRWLLRINPSDVPPEIDPEELDRELTHAITEFAADRGLRTNGPVIVEVVSDAAVPRGLTDCSGDSDPGPIDPWSQLVAASPPLVVEISDNRSILGRALECDIVLSIPELSRRQAIIVRANQAATIADLSSANGTHVNGTLIGADPYPLVPGDTVTMGDIDFIFRPI